MKDFVKSWKSSRIPKKQRKYVAKAPLHIRKKFVSVNLSKEIRKKYGKRNIPIRKGDTAKIMRGKFRDKKGKVLKVDLKKSRIIIEGIQVRKQDGSNVSVALRPSKLQIIELNLDDKSRANKIEASKSTQSLAQEKTK